MPNLLLCCFFVIDCRCTVQSWHAEISLIKICYLIQRRILIRTKSLKSLHPKSIWLRWSWRVSGVWSANWRRCRRAKGASLPGSRMLQLSWHTSRYFTSLYLNWLIFWMLIFLLSIPFNNSFFFLSFRLYWRNMLMTTLNCPTLENRLWSGHPG